MIQHQLIVHEKDNRTWQSGKLPSQLPKRSSKFEDLVEASNFHHALGNYRGAREHVTNGPESPDFRAPSDHRISNDCYDIVVLSWFATSMRVAVASLA